jgi:hypothetical protein
MKNFRRPTRKYADNIKMDLEIIGYDFVDYI